MRVCSVQLGSLAEGRVSSMRRVVEEGQIFELGASPRHASRHDLLHIPPGYVRLHSAHLHQMRARVDLTD